MQNANLTITRAIDDEESTASSSCPTLVLEQPGFATGSDTTTIAQIVAMVNSARNGESAWNVLQDACSYVDWDDEDEGVLHVSLPFYAMPSAPGLDFTVTASGVTLSGPTRSSAARTADAVFTASKSVQLEYYFESGSAEQLIPAFTADGEQVTVSATLSGSTLTLSQEVTTVFRVSGQATAYKYAAEFDLDRTPEKTVITVDGNGNEITRETKEVWMTLDKPSIAVLATWLCIVDDEGEEQSASLTLELPDCVSSMLTVCPESGKLKGGQVVPNAAGTLNVYYSTCSGEVLGNHVEEDN